MEEAEMKVLLQKYWEAETTVEEERQLAEYFRQPGIGPEWESVRALFDWRQEEAEVTPGRDFDERMLRRIAAMEKEGGRMVSGFAIRFAAAASIILCLGIGLLIPAVSPRPEGAAANTKGAAVDTKVAANNTKVTVHHIKDTYTDPEQALAAVRQALLVASVRMNEGRYITEKNIDRLQDTWQVATGQKKQL